ncbi:hypothetical protein Tco_0866826 [Tanacetum coccineum]
MVNILGSAILRRSIYAHPERYSLQLLKQHKQSTIAAHEEAETIPQQTTRTNFLSIDKRKLFSDFDEICREAKAVKDYAVLQGEDDECANKLNKEVSPEESSSTSQPLEQVQNHDENDVVANVRRNSEQPESLNDTIILEKDEAIHS